MNLNFSNGEPFPCGCLAHFSDGHGDYADSITVCLCEKHSPPSSPEDDAKGAGYRYSAAGTWTKQITDLCPTRPC